MNECLLFSLPNPVRIFATVMFSIDTLTACHNSLLVPHLKKMQRNHVCEKDFPFLIVVKNFALLVFIAIVKFRLQRN